MDWPTLIDTLKQIMQDEDIPVQQLADQLGVSASSVRNYLSKRQRASIATREKLEAFVAERATKAKKPAAKRNQKAAKDDKPATAKQTNKRGRGSKKAEDKPADKPADKTEDKQPAKRGRRQNAKAESDKQDNQQSKRRQQGNAKDASVTEEKPATKRGRRGGNKQDAAKNDDKQTETKPTEAKQNGRRGRQAKAQTETAKKAVEAAKPEQTADVQAETKQPAQPAATQAETQTSAKPETTTNTPAPSRSKTPAPRVHTQTPVRIYVDESFGQAAGKPFTVGMVLCNMTPGVMPFKEFTNTLYPFGWAPGDEVKAQGKDLANVKFVLEGSVNDDIRMMAFHTKMVPPLLAVNDDDSTMVSIFPYLSALITAIERMQKQGMTGTQFQIIIDRTNKLPAEALRVMQHLLDVYFRLAAPANLSFHVTDGDSRAQKGLQLADFVSHYAYVEEPQTALSFDAVTTVIDDELANARRFAYYSGLRLVQIKPGAKTLVQQSAPVAPAAETATATADDDATDDALTTNMSRAMALILAYKDTLQKAQAAGLQGKQLEAVRSRLKGLSTTVVNWLDGEKAKLLNGLANKSISDFHERLTIITRIDKPFRPSAEIGEQQFRIFETQLGRIEALLDSYSTTAEKN